MTLYIEKEVEPTFDFEWEVYANKVIEAALDYTEFPFECELSLTITDMEGIHSINKEFRNIDSPTDVLSFPMIDYDEPGNFDKLEELDEVFNPETGEVMLGDIVLCQERIYSQAKEYGHSVLREYAFLIAHSMLHLLGYDHMSEAEAKNMESMQEEILVGLNITRDN